MSRDRARSAIQGRKAQIAGDALESWVSAEHDKALCFGILAHVDKIDPPAEVRGGRIVFGEKTVSDYVGLLAPAPLGNDVIRNYPPTVWAELRAVRVSRYYACEAKSTELTYLPRSKITRKKQAHLDVVARAGGLALLVVRFTSEPGTEALKQALNWTEHERFHRWSRTYAVPWQAIEWQVLKTAESVSEEALRAGGWAVSGECFLERFHSRGVPSTQARARVYPRE